MTEIWAALKLWSPDLHSNTYRSLPGSKGIFSLLFHRILVSDLISQGTPQYALQSLIYYFYRKPTFLTGRHYDTSVHTYVLLSLSGTVNPLNEFPFQAILVSKEYDDLKAYYMVYENIINLM